MVTNGLSEGKILSTELKSVPTKYGEVIAGDRVVVRLKSCYKKGNGIIKGH